MSVTITQVRRALEEFGALPGSKFGHSMTSAAQLLASDPTACTLLANSINQKTGATLDVFIVGEPSGKLPKNIKRQLDE